jgi:hypothetical protein
MLETGKSQSESMMLHTTTLLSVFFAITITTIPRLNNSILLNTRMKPDTARTGIGLRTLEIRLVNIS